MVPTNSVASSSTTAPVCVGCDHPTTADSSEITDVWIDEVTYIDVPALVDFLQEKIFEEEVWVEDVPMKLEFKSKAPKVIHRNFKQPISRSGFKRGQRQEKN